MYKGSLNAYLSGNRTKLIELEDYYKKIDDVDGAKIKIFQNYTRYSAQDYFKNSIAISEAKLIKQAIAAVTQGQIEDLVH